MTATAYQPRRDLRARVSRRLLPLQARRDISMQLERSIVCFTFDDCPDSVPANALPLLEARGWPATLYVATGLMGRTNHHGRMMDEAEIRSAHAKGHEIAAHGHAHADMSGDLDAFADIRRSHMEFRRMRLPAPRSFAWPYGQATPALKSALAARYGSMRGIGPVTHTRRADLNQLGSHALFSGSSLERAHAALERTARRPGLITLFTHDVREGASKWGCTPAEFAGVVDHVAAIDARVMTVEAAVASILQECPQ